MARQLSDTEKAITQLMIHYGIIEESKLLELVKAVRKDLGGNDGNMKPLKESFVRINVNLRFLGMEVKSVVKARCTNVECAKIYNVRTPTCANCSTAGSFEWVYYHGIANTEECEVTKAFGSDLSPEEIKFFQDLVTKLLDVRYASVNDIYGLKIIPTWSNSQNDTVLEKLRLRGWLHRDTDCQWEIGARTFLECKLFLEQLIQNTDAPDDEDEESHRAAVKEQLDELPQVATY